LIDQWASDASANPKGERGQGMTAAGERAVLPFGDCGRVESDDLAPMC
jgi:hypothetical protein